MSSYLLISGVNDEANLGRFIVYCQGRELPPFVLRLD